MDSQSVPVHMTMSWSVSGM